jgi:hypothetical protein
MHRHAVVRLQVDVLATLQRGAWINMLGLGSTLVGLQVSSPATRACAAGLSAVLGSTCTTHQHPSLPTTTRSTIHQGKH